MDSFILPRIDPLKGDARFKPQFEPLIFIISAY
jgi:hypothetical protein